MLLGCSLGHSPGYSLLGTLLVLFQAVSHKASQTTLDKSIRQVWTFLQGIYSDTRNPIQTIHSVLRLYERLEKLIDCRVSPAPTIISLLILPLGHVMFYMFRVALLITLDNVHPLCESPPRSQSYVGTSSQLRATQLAADYS